MKKSIKKRIEEITENHAKRKENTANFDGWSTSELWQDLESALFIIDELQAALKEISECTFNEDGLCEVCRESINNIYIRT